MIDEVNATMKVETFKSVCFAADTLTLCMTPFIWSRPTLQSNTCLL